ncbi:hypothetical protein Tsubulata_006892 [Turnera subulata]|uniref:Fatty acid desaturase domain-containing protein n=1 Tax=Turnera subulata TaxID=218843 RepID=A0A9Q0GEG6_9ROSI|nr:hypothetical protein Tsubulata_006892 [Turnera subulata]
MGAYQRISSELTPKKKESQPRTVPSDKPPFTLGTLKKAIPAHCSQPSLICSFSYLVYDLSVCYTLFYIAKSYIPSLPYSLRYLSWPVYWFIQGAFLSGVWVIGHECGHHAFSDYQWVDNIVGFILHSALMTPFFAWKYSNHKHHSNTGSLSQDEVYLPRLKNVGLKEILLLILGLDFVFGTCTGIS